MKLFHVLSSNLIYIAIFAGLIFAFINPSHAGAHAALTSTTAPFAIVR